jgi:type I restriction enzyme, S subunit
MRRLPESWASTQLTALAKAQYGKGLPASARQPGRVLVYGSAGITGFHDVALVDEPVVIVGRKGNAGACHVSNGPSWPIDTAYFLRPPAGVDVRFLGFQLSAAGLRSLDSSTAVPSLRRTALEAVRIDLPPENEQRRIVTAIEEQFSRLDAADASVSAAARRLELIASALLTAAVKGPWPVKPLGDVATSFRYGTSVKCLLEAEGPAVLRIPNVRNRRIETSNLKYSTAPAGALGDCFVADGDLLFVRTNGSPDLIGRVGAFNDPAPFAFASYLIRARPQRNVLDQQWATLVLSTPAARADIVDRAATTAGQYNLNLPALRALQIPLPPLDEQRRIVAEIEQRLSVIDAARAAIEAAQRRSAALRRSILERAFRGELVPQDPSDEPASVLLERIRAERAATPVTRRRRVRDTQTVTDGPR